MKSIETLPIFEDLNQELIYFLADLSPDEWQQPTLVDGYTVKDVTSQIVFASLRRISFQRDHFFSNEGLSNPSTSVQPNNIRSNITEWTVAMRQISPRLLVEMLKKYEQELFELLARLRFDEVSIYPIDVEPQSIMPNWLDVAQIYARKWLLQMFLRRATGKSLLTSERFLLPWYETVLWALPEHLNKVAGAFPDQTLDVEITGEIRLRNRLQKTGSQWSVVQSTNDAAATTIKMPASIGWLVFSGVEAEADNRKIVLESHGDEALIELVLLMRPAFL